ncbi:MAG TPA: hypothetical protein P5121_21965 [Caldilineaceae bacterium]|nr:hypothetical protein [Caldilineaceae bacterium]
MNRNFLIVMTLSCMLCACRAQPTEASRSEPTPTIAAIFSKQDAIVPPVRSDSNLGDLLNRDSSQPSGAEVISTTGVDAVAALNQSDAMNAAPDAMPVREVMLYDEGLLSGWTLEQSNGMSYSLNDEANRGVVLNSQTGLVNSGFTIRATPQTDYGVLFFTVPQTATNGYLRDDVLGISFWLGTGDEMIAPEDFAVSIRGSDRLPYWAAQDDEEFQRDYRDFSETRLYFLDLNRAIPPHTWTQITVWLDNLVFDPTYTYVTGFYIKNDIGIRTTFYVDKVALLFAP